MTLWLAIYIISIQLSSALQLSLYSTLCGVIPGFDWATNYGRPVRKSPSLHSWKSIPNFLGTAEAYLVCYIIPNFQIYLIYAFIGCPQSVEWAIKSRLICALRDVRE